MVSYIVITVAFLISGGVVFLTLANFYNEKKQKRLAEENEFYLLSDEAWTQWHLFYRRTND